MQTLSLDERFFADIRAGSKRDTLRCGKKDVIPGALRFYASQNPDITCDVVVTAVHVLPLTEAASLMDEPIDIEGLLARLRPFYPDILAQERVTLIKFAIK